MYHVVILSDNYGTPARGPMQIAHHMRQHGYKVKVIHYVESMTEPMIDSMIRKYISPNTILGVSTTFLLNPHLIYKFVEKAKQKHPTIKVMAGGVLYFNGFDHLYDIDMRGSYVEDKVIDFLNRHFGKIVKKPFNIESLDFQYCDEDIFPDMSVLPIEISRHCVFNCKFCNFYNRGMKMNDRNYDLVLKEMEQAHEKFGTYKFIPVCSTFNDRTAKLDGTLGRFHELSFNPELGAYIRFELLLKQKEYWPLYKEYFKYMVFGLETFNWRSGQAVGKGMHPDKVKDGLLEVREYFPDTILMSAFITGLPFDTPDDHYGAVEWLNKTKALDSAQFRHLFLSRILPGVDYQMFSQFDLETEAYGYKHLNNDDLYDAEWIREDGLTSMEAAKLAEECNNNLEIGGYISFSAMFVSQWQTRAQLREMAPDHAKWRTYKQQCEKMYALKYHLMNS